MVWLYLKFPCHILTLVFCICSNIQLAHTTWRYCWVQEQTAHFKVQHFMTLLCISARKVQKKLHFCICFVCIGCIFFAVSHTKAFVHSHQPHQTPSCLWPPYLHILSSVWKKNKSLSQIQVHFYSFLINLSCWQNEPQRYKVPSQLTGKSQGVTPRPHEGSKILGEKPPALLHVRVARGRGRGRSLVETALRSIGRGVGHTHGWSQVLEKAEEESRRRRREADCSWRRSGY